MQPSPALTPITDCEDDSSWGDPSSPSSSSSVANEEKVHQCAECSVRKNDFDINDDYSLYGMDTTAFSYEMDKVLQFELADGGHLQGEKLIQHLLQCNDKLEERVKLYAQRCSKLQEEIHKERHESHETVNSVRNFYKNIIFEKSRGAIMLRKGLQNRKSHC